MRRFRAFETEARLRRQDVEQCASPLEDRDGVAAAAATAGTAFFGPLAGGWFTGGHPAPIGDDGVHPDDARHAYMADLMQPPSSA